MSVTPQELSELERIQSRITSLRAEEARYAQDTSTEGQRQLQTSRDQLIVEENLLNTEQERVGTQTSLNKELTTFAKSYAKLSSSVKSQLQTQSSINNQTSIYKSLAEDIARSKVREAGLTGDELDAEIDKGSFMAEINASLLSQAKATAKAIDDAEGLTEFDKMRRDLKESMISLSDDERKKMEDAINLTETLFKKEERIKSIQESQKSLYEAAPESLRSGIDFAKKLGDTLKTAGAGAVAFMLLAAVVTAAITSFTALDSAAKEFRETTGLTNSQMAGIKSDANEIVGEFGAMGVEAKNVFDTVAGLKSEFGDASKFSKETVAALTLMNTNFGIAAEDATKVQGIMEQVGGLSSETAVSVGIQAINMAKVAGVAPAKVMKDIAENAEAASTFFKGDLNALTKNAVQARRMGSSLKEQVALSEKLLDFEAGIEDELVAATFVSGQFNLSKARALAFEGKTADAAAETLRQIQRSGDFRKQDFFTQQQLAKASGMTVEEINKQLDTQDKLSKLTTDERTKAEEAIKQGLDITNIDKDQLALETEKFAKQQEQQASLEQIQNAFMGIVSTVGSVLVPLLETITPILTLALTPVAAIASGMASFVNYVKESAPLLSAILGITTGIAVQKGLAFFFAKDEFGLTQSTIVLEKAKFAINKALIPLEIAMNNLKKKGLLKTIYEMVARSFTSAASIPFVGFAIAGGVAAAALAFGMGLFSKAGDVNSPADGVTRVSTKEGGLFELSPDDDLVAAPGASAALAGGEGSPNTISIDFSALSAPLNMMINEIKGLRADMASGKIAVYMDTAKVTSNIGRQVDAGTKNNYSLGQA